MNARKLFFRPSKTPRVAIPCGARSVGHYCVGTDYIEPPVRKHFVQVFWGIGGAGCLTIGRRPCILRAEQIAVYMPGDVHRIRPVEEPWEYRWWTLDGPMAKAVAQAFGLRGPWPKQAGACPVHLFARLEKEIPDASPSGEFLAGATAYELLALTAGRLSGLLPANAPQETMPEKCLALIRARHADAGLCIKALAAELGTHRSCLSREFRKRFGVPPVAYIHALRLEKALSLLRETDLPILDIARQSGFADAAYFSRCVAHATGLPPSRLRRQGGGGRKR